MSCDNLLDHRVDSWRPHPKYLYICTTKCTLWLLAYLHCTAVLSCHARSSDWLLSQFCQPRVWHFPQGRSDVQVQKAYNCTFDWILSSRPEVFVFSELSPKPFGLALCMAAVPHVQFFVCKQAGVCWVWFVPRGSWHANTGVPVVTHPVPRCFRLLVTIWVTALPITKEILASMALLAAFHCRLSFSSCAAKQAVASESPETTMQG